MLACAGNIAAAKPINHAFGRAVAHAGQFTQVYYVATNGSNGTGNGSQSSPWASIEYAIDQVVDGSIILVKPGTYHGRVHLSARFNTGITIRSEVPYQARLRNNSRVIVCFYGEGITLEGFDIAHDPPVVSDTVIQIQDLLGTTNGPSDGEVVSDIVLRNNVIHDSYDNDIIKINNGAVDILIEGNMFYNQAGVDEHLDINSVAHVVIQDNIFFNDYAGSGRPVDNLAQVPIAIKDSNGDADDFVGARNVTVRRNVFLNFEGRNDGNFVQVGSNEAGYFGAFDVLIENNLMLGNSGDEMRAAFGITGSRAVTIRYNTVVGDLPALAYAMRLFGIVGPDSEDIRFFGNIWADPTGTMQDFSDSPPEDTVSFVLEGNLYWNGGNPIPENNSELANYTDDPDRIIGDPLLPSQAGLVVPRWMRATDRFADGSHTIQEAFERLVSLYGIPANGSAAVDTGSGTHCPATDLRGLPRPVGSGCDLGAIEIQPACPGGDDTLVVKNTSVLEDTEYVACSHITLGPKVTIVAPANVAARAGVSVALGSGFLVEQGATFEAIIDKTSAVKRFTVNAGAKAARTARGGLRGDDIFVADAAGVFAYFGGHDADTLSPHRASPTRAGAKATLKANGVPVPALSPLALLLLLLLLLLPLAARWRYWKMRVTEKR